MTLRTNYNDGGATPAPGNITAADLNAISTAVNTAEQTGNKNAANGYLGADTNGKLALSSIDASGAPSSANFLRGDGSWATPAGGGTVTTVTFSPANGFAATIANPTSTPAITLSTSVTGILKGNGTTMSAATAGTDYSTPSATETLTNKTISGAANSISNVGVSSLAATGTASSSTYLRGDGTWNTPSGGGGTPTTLTNETLITPTITGYTETVQALGTVTTTKTIPAPSSGTIMTVTLTNGDLCAFTLPTPVLGTSFTLAVFQPSTTGSGTYSFTTPSGSLNWPQGASPSMTSGANKYDLLSFICLDGTNWTGSYQQGF